MPHWSLKLLNQAPKSRLQVHARWLCTADVRAAMSDRQPREHRRSRSRSPRRERSQQHRSSERDRPGYQPSYQGHSHPTGHGPGYGSYGTPGGYGHGSQGYEHASREYGPPGALSQAAPSHYGRGSSGHSSYGHEGAEPRHIYSNQCSNVAMF